MINSSEARKITNAKAKTSSKIDRILGDIDVNIKLAATNGYSHIDYYPDNDTWQSIRDELVKQGYCVEKTFTPVDYEATLTLLISW